MLTLSRWDVVSVSAELITEYHKFCLSWLIIRPTFCQSWKYFKLLAKDYIILQLRFGLHKVENKGKRTYFRTMMALTHDFFSLSPIKIFYYAVIFLIRIGFLLMANSVQSFSVIKEDINVWFEESLQSNINGNMVVSFSQISNIPACLVISLGDWLRGSTNLWPDQRKPMYVFKSHDVNLTLGLGFVVETSGKSMTE